MKFNNLIYIGVCVLAAIIAYSLFGTSKTVASTQTQPYIAKCAELNGTITTYYGKRQSFYLGDVWVSVETVDNTLYYPSHSCTFKFPK